MKCGDRSEGRDQCSVTANVVSGYSDVVGRSAPGKVDLRRGCSCGGEPGGGRRCRRIGRSHCSCPGYVRSFRHLAVTAYRLDRVRVFRGGCEAGTLERRDRPQRSDQYRVAIHVVSGDFFVARGAAKWRASVPRQIDLRCRYRRCGQPCRSGGFRGAETPAWGDLFRASPAAGEAQEQCAKNSKRGQRCSCHNNPPVIAGVPILSNQGGGG